MEHKKNLLIVDDVTLNCEIVSEYFSSKYNIFTAQDGLSALSIVKREKLDLVITDIFMPKMDGFTLIKEIRERETVFHLPIIAITEQGEKFEIEAIRKGADDFINKPFNLELLDYRMDILLHENKGTNNYFQKLLFSFSYIKIPFAIVKLNKTEKGEYLKYQYINDAFAALFKVDKDEVLSDKFNIKEENFINLLKAQVNNDTIQSNTFHSKKYDTYFDIICYSNNDDFFCFSILQNAEVELHKKEISRYRYLVNEIFTSDENALCAFYCNVSRQVCYKEIGILALDTLKQADLCNVGEKILSLVVDEEVKKKFMSLLTQKNFIRLYEEGNTQINETFLALVDKNNYCWVDMQIKLVKNPNTKELESFIRIKNINEAVLSQKLIDVIIRKDYDSLFYFDLASDTAYIYNIENSLFWNHPYVLKNANEAVLSYLEASYVGEDKEQFLKDNSFYAIADKMQESPKYTVDYCVIENGKRRLKHATYSWMDEYKKHLCFLRNDITLSLEKEQQRNAELEKKLEEARADERRQSADKERLINKYYEEMRQKAIMQDHLFRNIPGGIAVYKVGETVESLYYNEGFISLLGFDPKEDDAKSIIAMKIDDFIFEEDRERTLQEIRKCAAQGIPYQTTLRLKTQKDEIVWVMLSAVKIREDDGQAVYYAINTSVPNQVVQFAQICENSPSPIFVLSLRNKQILYNNTVAQSVNSNIFNNDIELIYNYCIPIDEREYTLTESVEFCKEVTIQPSGKTYTVRSKVINWNNDPSMAIFLSDETNLLKERKQKEKLIQAEAASKAKTDFLSRVSHDMRTPLTGILGLTYLSQDCQEIDKLQDYLKQIGSLGQLLQSLINDTLEMNAIESGKVKLNLKAFEEKEMCDTILEVIQPQLAKKNIKLNTDFNFCQWRVIYADPQRLQRILLNVLSNAIKFSPIGSSITFKIETLEIKNDHLYQRFYIKDNGVGMSKEFQTHLFEMFKQENRINTDGQVGSGLGLSIVKALVTLMGGKIMINSIENIGTEVIINLAFPIVKHVAPEAKAPVLSDNLKNSHILLCEDQPLNAKIVIKILEKFNAIVDWAEDGKQGIEKYDASPLNYYQAILMDVRMPVMGGIEATQALRKLEREDAAFVPIIALTANAFDEDVKSVLKAGMNAHLSKPIEVNKLVGLLNCLIERG